MNSKTELLTLEQIKERYGDTLIPKELAELEKMTSSIKEEDKPYTKISLEFLTSLLGEMSVDMPYMEQVSPGLWKISSGGKNPTIMYTGDGGAEDFRKAMKEAAKEFNSEVL